MNKSFLISTITVLALICVRCSDNTKPISFGDTKIKLTDEKKTTKKIIHYVRGDNETNPAVLNRRLAEVTVYGFKLSSDTRLLLVRSLISPISEEEIDSVWEIIISGFIKNPEIISTYSMDQLIEYLEDNS